MPASVLVDVGLERKIFAHAQCFSTADGGRCRKDDMRRASRWRLRAVSREMSCAGDSLIYLWCIQPQEGSYVEQNALGIRDWQANLVVSDGVQYFQGLTHVHEVRRIIQIQERLPKFCGLWLMNKRLHRETKDKDLH